MRRRAMICMMRAAASSSERGTLGLKAGGLPPLRSAYGEDAMQKKRNRRPRTKSCTRTNLITHAIKK